MANLTYRASTAATTPSSTTAKGTPLTNLELDGNLKSLNDDLALKATTTSLTSGLQTASDNATALAIALG
jgi:hypothetical protein